ncbi:MAG: CoA-binding protein [Betaproteobacteria bacterium HGW-Betaproteobacteria-11]|nr:MAG: CoA-binding protein [Betaproteobacteria bacterium HGW-Betaproteobacteria-11]
MTGSNEILHLLATTRVIAVVGLSPDPARASQRVARYMQAQGYRIVPVNPAAGEILGERCYPDLASIPHPVDMVDVFRRADRVLPIAQQAIAIGARCLWLQLGVVNDEAIRQAAAAGLAVVVDRCLMVEHAKHAAALASAPGHAAP